LTYVEAETFAQKALADAPPQKIILEIFIGLPNILDTNSIKVIYSTALACASRFY